MRTHALLLVLCAPLIGCAPANYLYGFDIADPSAVNYKDFRRADVLSDSDVKLEVRADPAEFRAIAIDVTNKTDSTLLVGWDHITLVGPDHMERPLSPQTQPGSIEPTAKISAVLGVFELPTVGPAAKAYDGSVFELVVPTVVRGTPREYRVHLRATLKKL